MCWRTPAGAQAAKQTAILLKIPSTSNLRVCGCSHTTRNGSCARVSTFLYLTFNILFPECVAVVESDGWSTNSMSTGVNIKVTQTRKSPSRLYCGQVVHTGMTAFCCKTLTHAPNTGVVAWTDIFLETLM